MASHTLIILGFSSYNEITSKINTKDNLLSYGLQGEGEFPSDKNVIFVPCKDTLKIFFFGKRKKNFYVFRKHKVFGGPKRITEAMSNQFHFFLIWVTFFHTGSIQNCSKE